MYNDELIMRENSRRDKVVTAISEVGWTYITALIFSNKSKTISPFGPLSSGVAFFFFFFIEAVSSSDKKDQDKGAKVSIGVLQSSQLSPGPLPQHRTSFYVVCF